MLVRATKPRFATLHEAAKQLLIWTFGRRQEIHSTCHNSNKDDEGPWYHGNYRKHPRNYGEDEETEYNGRRAYRRDYGNYGGYRDHRRGFQNFFTRKKWDMESFSPRKPIDLHNLKELKKDFYIPHPNVLNRPEDEIKDFYRTHDVQIFGKGGENCPPPVLSFDELCLSKQIMNVLGNLDYVNPTPIQSLTWPIALSGLDMVGIGRTGSGKTLGFVLPGLIHTQNQLPLEDNEGPIVLVISPTRELAEQTYKVFSPFAGRSDLNLACVFGGASKQTQMSKLRRAHICVGTPGRLIDFLNSEVIDLSRCTYIVLDEADRLLDMGFEPQIRNLLSTKRPDSQILMFSATWPREIRNLASEFCKNFVGVQFGSSELSANPNIVQKVYVCERQEKRSMLLNLLQQIFNTEDKKTLIFAQTKLAVTQLYYLLSKKGYPAVETHGDKTLQSRYRAVERFRNGGAEILIGTGLVGRGLDFRDIKHVILYDFPNVIEDYIHTIGRTGRCDKPGTSYAFFTPNDSGLANDLINVLNQTNQEVPSDLKDLRSSGHRGGRRKIFR